MSSSLEGIGGTKGVNESRCSLSCKEEKRVIMRSAHGWVELCNFPGGNQMQLRADTNTEQNYVVGDMVMTAGLSLSLCA